MVLDFQRERLLVKMVNTSPGCRSQSHMLCCLYLLKARFTCIGTPNWCSIACDIFPQCVVGQQDDPTSASSILFLLWILYVYQQCLRKDKDGSIFSPSILGLRYSGSCVSLRVISGCVWNWFVSAIKIVTVDFGAEIKSEFTFR